ncbi:hypothetical protein M0802_010118 [Mischocyttarus mexicanus]|nr:hypothetical protein M0802_010118 [Mischocyttarus mexicanus]
MNKTTLAAYNMSKKEIELGTVSMSMYQEPKYGNLGWETNVGQVAIVVVVVVSSKLTAFNPGLSLGMLTMPYVESLLAYL